MGLMVDKGVLGEGSLMTPGFTIIPLKFHTTL